jgi:hypothetical protein
MALNSADVERKRVELTGIEPVAFAMPWRRSSN